MQLSKKAVIGTRLRVVVVVDHLVLQDALVDLLGEDPDFELTAIARTPHDAVFQARCRQPDVLLVDLDLSGGAGERIVADISGEMPQIRVIVMSGLMDRVSSQRVQLLGADTYLPKGADVVDSMRSFFPI